MIDQKHFNGRLNTDDSGYVIAPGDHAMSKNVRFRGNPGNLRAEGVPGTYVVTNDNLPVGDNECIGSFYDSLKQRVIFFNYNSNGRNGIYQYDVKNGLITKLLLCFTDSQTDILGFSLDYPIPSVNIIYTTEQDGDLLIWTARNKRPKILNLLSAQNRIYGSDWLEEYLDVAKAPPSIPIRCAYEDDNTALINNMRKQLFLPQYRFIYGDNLKSVWSARGNVAIPFNYVSPQVDTNPTKNCRIGCVLQTGGSDVRKLEVAMSLASELGDNSGNEWGIPFSVVILDKDELSIPDNDVYVYYFYNNEAYVSVDEKENILGFDYVPDIANTQELLNGNVIVYGGIQEGLDPVVPDVSVSTSLEYASALDSSSIFSVTQNGLYGFGTGNITFVVLGNIRINDIYSAQIQVGVTTYTITYTAAIGDTPADVLAGLSTSATGQGFTQVSINSNTLVISRTNQVLLKSRLQGIVQTFAGTVNLNSAGVITLINGAAYQSLFPKGTFFYVTPVVNSGNTIMFTVKQTAIISVTNLAIDVVVAPAVTESVVSATVYILSALNISQEAYDWNTKENYAIAYFDEKGKTNGSTTSAEFSATTTFDVGGGLGTLLYKIPTISLSINHRPPIWAKYFHVLRTNNLTKQKYLYWVSDRTYKDDKYGYISVESIQSYKILNPNSIISYDFASGDRIRFMILYNADGSVGAPVLYRDYEIYSQVLNPEINGIVRNGQFLKIVLPDDLDAFFNFGDGVTRTYFYYYIELYTPAKSAGAKLDTYYEFVQRYEIGNPGTDTRFHQGMIQNQSTDLVTPATFLFDRGDAYFRYREINVGNIISYDLLPENSVQPGYIIPQRIKSEIILNPEYEVAPDVPYQQLITTGGLYNNAGWTISVNTPSYIFTAKGTIALVARAATASQVRVQIGIADSGGTITYYVLGSKTGLTNGEEFGFTYSLPITWPAHSKSFLHIASSDNAFVCDVLSGAISYTEPNKSFIIGVVDQNFSDFYDSKINENGRSWVVNPDEKTIFFQTLLRWGLAYQQNTNINQINRFFPLNFDEVDRAKGTIQRFAAWARQLIIFQELAVGRYGVYNRYIQSNSTQLTTTDEILTQNNIQYYEGNYGMGKEYCSLTKGRNCFYFVDPIRAYHVRLSADGLTPISEINKGQFYIQPLFSPYNKDFIRADGGFSKILGAYNFYEEEAIVVLQSGSLGIDVINPYTFSWNEKRNSYCTFFDLVNMDWITSAEDKIIVFKNGMLHVWDNNSKYCNFLGTQYYPSITLVFNDKDAFTKTFLSLGYEANQLWTAEEIGDVITSQPNDQTALSQISAIKDWCFQIQEGRYHANLLRDANSMPDQLQALNEGDVLKGVYIIIKLTYKGNDSSFLYLPYINSAISNRNF